MLSVSTQKVISQVSLGVGLFTVGGSTWLSLPLLPSGHVESSPRSSYRCLKGISREDDCDRHYYKGNSQKPWCCKFRFDSRKNPALEWCSLQRCGGFLSSEISKDPSHQRASCCGSEVCNKAVQAVTRPHTSQKHSHPRKAQLLLGKSLCCILPLTDCSGTAQHYTVSLCSLHTLKGCPKTALLPELVLSIRNVGSFPSPLARLSAPSPRLLRAVAFLPLCTP